jgi:Lysyl oxidase
MARSLALALLLVGSAARAQGLSDLRLDTDLLAASVKYDLQLFDPADPSSCELQPADLCVSGPGVRKLLRFSVLAVNQGTADLVVGTPDASALNPDGTPKWVYSACHKHFHFQTFARYELRPRGAPGAVLVGQKRSFCIEDTRKVSPSSPDQARYGCNPNGLNVQGVQVGWGDLYASNLPCQWIDVTDLAATGDYDLCVFLNTARLLPDADPGNDAGCVPITIDGPSAGAVAPKVVLRAPRQRTKARVGKRLKVAWRKRVRGEFRFVEIFFSRDGGATWQFVGASQDGKRNTYGWVPPADAVTESARMRVVVWSQAPGAATGAGAFLHTVRDGKPFRIVP